MNPTSILKGEDPRHLTEVRLKAILDGLKDQPGVEELTAHIAALDERLTITSQYYEEFLIPEMERGTFAGRVGRGERTGGREP